MIMLKLGCSCAKTRVVIRLLVFDGSSSQLEVTSLWDILIAKSFEGQVALHQECTNCEDLEFSNTVQGQAKCPL